MIWYLLNILIITCAWLWPVNIVIDKKEVVKKSYIVNALRRKRVCIIATINWIILSGLRDWSVGADTLAYKEYFDETIFLTWGECFSKIYLKYIQGIHFKDPGYLIVMKFFQIFSTNYQMFLIFIAVIFFVPLGLLIYKYSKEPYLSYILFSSLFYSFFAITGHRQTIATSIVVFGGIKLIKKRKLLKFLLLITIASTIHTSVICFLPFYWISKIRINKVSLIFYWSLIVISFLFKEQFLILLQQMAGYEEYSILETAGGGNFIFLLYMLLIYVTIFYGYFTNNEIIEISTNALFIAGIFSSLVFLNQSFMRVVQYYSIFIMFLLPQCKYVFIKKNRMYFKISCSILMILILIKNQPEYVFFWQEIFR